MTFVGYLGWYKPSYKLSKGSDLTIALPKYNKKKMSMLTQEKKITVKEESFIYSLSKITQLHMAGVALKQKPE